MKNRAAHTLVAIALLIGGAGVTARADSTTAFCVFSRHDHTIPVEKGPCHFSQRQGNADNDSKTDQRQANDVSLRFNRESDYTLTIYWQKPTPQKRPW